MLAFLQVASVQVARNGLSKEERHVAMYLITMEVPGTSGGWRTSGGWNRVDPHLFTHRHQKDKNAYRGDKNAYRGDKNTYRAQERLSFGTCCAQTRPKKMDPQDSFSLLSWSAACVRRASKV